MAPVVDVAAAMALALIASTHRTPRRANLWRRAVGPRSHENPMVQPALTSRHRATPGERRPLAWSARDGFRSKKVYAGILGQGRVYGKPLRVGRYNGLHGYRVDYRRLARYRPRHGASGWGSGLGGGGELPQRGRCRRQNR